MRNADVITAYITRTKARNLNLRSSGNELINYDTVISYRENGKFFLNVRKYSNTTTKIQNEIRRQANMTGIEINEFIGNPI